MRDVMELMGDSDRDRDELKRVNEGKPARKKLLLSLDARDYDEFKAWAAQDHTTMTALFKRMCDLERRRRRDRKK